MAARRPGTSPVIRDLVLWIARNKWCLTDEKEARSMSTVIPSLPLTLEPIPRSAADSSGSHDSL